MYLSNTSQQFPCVSNRSHSSKKKDEGGIASGAYFEPSFSRRSKGQAHIGVEYEQASAVACHVQGLNGTTGENLFYRTVNLQTKI